MLVKAKGIVYYNDKRYREDQTFELVERKGIRKFKDEKGEEIVLSPEAQFSERSMIRVDADGRELDGPVVKKEVKSEEVKSEGIVESVKKKVSKKASKKKASSDDDVI